ncbi:FAD-binding and (Fe-S)-binding domain-containing protein [Tessaracoccus terricola]
MRRAQAHDASHFLLVPAEIATPSSANDVALLFAEARHNRRHITFRSGGTSLSGQGLTDDLLVDTRKEFRGIEVLDDGARVRVGPGATLRHVNAVLARHGRKLGPDPASEIAATVGGVVANNSSGMLCGTRDNTYATLESMVFVLPSGRVVDTSDPDADIVLRLHEPALVNGLLMLRRRIRSNPETEAEVRRQFAIKNTMGYGVNALLDFHRPVDIARHLLIGSEGTLAFVASATFRTLPLKQHGATGLAIFPSLEAATESLPALVAAGFDAIELMDATALRVAQGLPEATPELRALEVVDHTALLLELQDESVDALAERIAATIDLLAGLPLTQPVALSGEAPTRAALWKIRKGLYTTVAGNRPEGSAALLEDIAVPVERLAETCRKLTALFTKHGYEASVIFGHARDGNLHFMLNEQFDDPGSLRRYRRFTRDLVRMVLAMGGTLKAEHGTGRVMAPFVQDQYGDELFEIMREIKSLFDPTNMLNPGVLITTDRNAHTKHLKLQPKVEPEVDACVECGYCEPACPSRDLTLTPRQRIVLRRELAANPDDEELAEAVAHSYDYANNQTCAVDGMCGVSCPLGINTGDLVRRLREEQATPGEQRTWKAAAKSWGPVTKLGGKALTTAKHSGPLAGIATKLGRRALGADVVPAYDPGLPSGGKQIRRRPPRREVGRDVAVAAYFPACIQTMFGSEGQGVYRAFEELCTRAGVPVRLMDAEGLCCGTPWKSKGLTDGLDVMEAKVRARLKEEAPATIVCDASSCTDGLRRMAERNQDVHVVDILEFARVHLLPQLSVTAPIDSIVLHPTCSTTQLGLDGHLRAIAKFISDDVTVPTAWGCCGFAGDRGLLHPELTASATAAEAEEVGRRSYAAYASANRTCEIGMTRATGQPYVHVVELLAQATRPAQP